MAVGVDVGPVGVPVGVSVGGAGVGHVVASPAFPASAPFFALDVIPYVYFEREEEHA